MRKGGEVARAPQGLSAAENQTQPCVRNRDGCLGKLCLLVSSAQKWEGVVGCCPAAFIMQTLAAVQQCSKRVGPGRLLSSSI